MPMILGPGGGKLSKRHGSVSIEEYRDAGYLPSALVNYLTLLGWGPEDGREVLSIDELVAEFEVERVISSSATFDAKKLEWMNGEHIRAMPLPDLVSAVLPFARNRYAETLDIPRFEKAALPEKEAGGPIGPGRKAGEVSSDEESVRGNPDQGRAGQPPAAA